MRRSLSLALVLLGCLDHDPAEAARHALLVANNRGWASEVPLQFAHQDVLRLAGTLQEIGGFEKKNITVLLDATPKEIDAALRRLASRIRGQPGGDLESLLLFYYSGHADDRALHPGPSSLPYEDLKRRIEEVPASVRLALLDSCKSGALTRLKGASLGPSFDVQLLPSSKVTGDVFISSASVSESAQESRQLGGSFFTTYVNTGLRGAADTNGDGIVTLAELYAFAYVMTVGRTSGTPGGIQHPTYRFDLRGRGELALTRPGKATACILFERGARDRRFNVLDAGTGALIAEVPASPSGTTRIGLDAGRYKVRRWTPGAVLEIEVRLLAQECRQILEHEMRRIIVPETLSKGELLSVTWSVGAGYDAALLSPEPTVPLHRMHLSLRIPVSRWALRPHFQYGHSEYTGKILGVTTDLFSLGASVTRDWATPWGLVGVGPVASFLVLSQRLDPWSSNRVAGLLVGGEGSFAVPLPWWRMALGVSVRLGDGMYGFTADMTHSLALELGVGLQCWWQGPVPRSTKE